MTDTQEIQLFRNLIRWANEDGLHDLSSMLWRLPVLQKRPCARLCTGRSPTGVFVAVVHELGRSNLIR